MVFIVRSGGILLQIAALYCFQTKESTSNVPSLTPRKFLIAACFALLCILLLHLFWETAASSNVPLDRGYDLLQPTERRKETSLFWDPVSESVVDTCNDYSDDCVACNNSPLPERCIWVYVSADFAAGSTVAEAGSTGTPGGACRTSGPSLYGGEAQLRIPNGGDAAVECNTAGEQSGATPSELTNRCQQWAADAGNECLAQDCGATGAYCCGFQGWEDDPPSTMPGLCVSGAPQYCLYDQNTGSCLATNPFG